MFICGQLSKKLLPLLLNRRWQFCVRKLLSQVLATGNCIRDKVLYGALLVAVLAVTNEEEAYSGDWIGVLGRCWRINNWRSYILLKGGAKCTHGGQRASRAWSHVLTCPVLNRSDRQALVLGIAQFEISNGPWCLCDQIQH